MNHDPLAQPGTVTVVPVALPESIYGPLWREATARDITVAALIVERLTLESDHAQP